MVFAHCAFFLCVGYIYLNAMFAIPQFWNWTVSLEEPIGRKTCSICIQGNVPQVQDVDLDNLKGNAIHVGGEFGSREAYVTLLTSDYYLPGTLVFIHSIRAYMERDRDIVVVITPAVSENSIKALQAACVIIKRVKSQGNPNQSYQPRFEDAYTKMAIWAIDEYDKMVYGDSDQFAVKSYDSLFDFPAFSAEERTWKDPRYTSSLMVFEPSRAVFRDMKSKFSAIKSDDGADMGFITSYFPQEPNKTIPYSFAIWRRTILESPDHWDWEKIHGIDCSGLHEQKIADFKVGRLKSPGLKTGTQMWKRST